MDPVLGSLLSAVLGGGTIAAVLNYLQVRRSQKAGVPAKEDDAVTHTNATVVAAGAGDWQALNTYWQNELAGKNTEITSLRQELSQVRAAARRRERHLEQKLDFWAAHIWRTTGHAPPEVTDPQTKDPK